MVEIDILNSQKASHISPWWVSYSGIYCGYLEQKNSIIMAPCYITTTKKHIKSVHIYVIYCAVGEGYFLNQFKWAPFDLELYDPLPLYQ